MDRPYASTRIFAFGGFFFLPAGREKNPMNIRNGLAIYVGTLIAILRTKPRLGTAGAVLFCLGGALTMEQCYDETSA
jgi:hypothetical protein